MPRFILLVLFVLLSASSAAAQRGGMSFLKIGTSAAGIAMGEANVAHSRGALATYWNPAGLAATGSNVAGVTHHRWVADIRTIAFAARFQLGQYGGLGLAVTATGSGDIEMRDMPGDPAGLFDAQFASIGLSYAHALGPIRAGFSAKYLIERIFVESANGYAMDAGVQASLFGGSILAGAAVQHFGRMQELDVQRTELPQTVRAGVAVYPLRILAADDRFAVLNTTITAEIVRNLPDEHQRFLLGASAAVLDMLIFRGGYMFNDELRYASLGGGVLWQSFRFDYAFVPFREGFGPAGHVVTLEYLW